MSTLLSRLKNIVLCRILRFRKKRATYHGTPWLELEYDFKIDYFK